MKSVNNSEQEWFVYLMICSDNSLYCGYTNNISRRLKRHSDGNGAKYTRTRRPLKMVYSESCTTKSDAMRREYAIKQMSRQQKNKVNRRIVKPILLHVLIPHVLVSPFYRKKFYIDF